jgi:TRAP-type C4-dicarboxylate transport system permease small subunit
VAGPTRSAADPTNPVLRGLAVAENALVLILLAGTVLTILTQVFFRYALSRPLSWSTEVATDLLVYIAFVGFAIGVRDNAHVALNLFERKLGMRSRRVQRIVELAVLTAVLLVLSVSAILYMREQTGVVSQTGIPVWAVALALPIGGFLGAFHAIVEIVALLRGAEPPGFEPPEAEMAEPVRPVGEPARAGGAA